MQAKLWLLGSAGDPREAREGQGRDRIDDDEEEEKSESEEGKKERKKAYFDSDRNSCSNAADPACKVSDFVQ